jgi:hypothetical protein
MEVVPPSTTGVAAELLEGWAWRALHAGEDVDIRVRRNSREGWWRGRLAKPHMLEQERQARS